MRRYWLALGMAFAMACATSSAALESTIAPSRAMLRGNVCQKALDPGQRTISVKAVMHSIPGTRQMQLKFVLLTKTAGAPAFTVVQGGDLGTWISPAEPTLG